MSLVGSFHIACLLVYTSIIFVHEVLLHFMIRYFLWNFCFPDRLLKSAASSRQHPHLLIYLSCIESYIKIK